MDGAAVIRRYREALFGGEIDAALELLHPELAFYPLKPGLVLGREQLRQIWSEPDEGYEQLTSELEPGELEELPDGRFLTVTRETLRWRETGEVAAAIDRASVWKLEGARIVEIRAFADPEAARAAIGVPA